MTASDLTAPVSTDDEVLARTEFLVGRAVRRQLWLLLLDEGGVQTAPIVQVDHLPGRPRLREPIGEHVAALAREVDAASVVVVYERPGPPDATRLDRAWAAALEASLGAAAVPVRALVISTAGGCEPFSSMDEDELTRGL